MNVRTPMWWVTEKAFDSVNHEFTFELMAAMNIPKEFITWIELAFIDTYACCIITVNVLNFIRYMAEADKVTVFILSFSHL